MKNNEKDREKEEFRPTTSAQILWLQQEIAMGQAEADRGEFVDGPEVFKRIREKSNRIRYKANQR